MKRRSPTGGEVPPAVLDARGTSTLDMTAQTIVPRASGDDAPQIRLAFMMSTNQTFVNVLPPMLSRARATELLRQYQLERDCPTPDSPPRWYTEAVIAALEAIVTDGAR